MAAWIIPALKAVLPHVGAIITAAAPVFTKRTADAAANQALLLQQQVAELQSAAAQNSEHVRELAAQLQGTVAALEQGAAIVQGQLRRTLGLCVAALALAAIALGVAIFASYGR